MSENIEHANDENFASHTSKGTVVVDFHADWCGPCRMIAPILEKMAVKLAGQVKIVKVNTDEARQVASKFGITSIPTLILLKEGKEVSRVVGVKDEKTLTQWATS